MDNALKALTKTDEEIRVANYIVLFGGRDLTSVITGKTNPDGSMGDYFSPNTDLESDYTKAGILYVDWEHGKDPERSGIGDAPLGYVDWKTARTDDKGVFVERVLSRRNRYVQLLEELIDAGLIGNSSEALPGGVQKSNNGEITRWPLRRDTLTVSPMEPRMLSENHVAALKALSDAGLNVTSLLPQLPEVEPTGEAEVSGEDTPSAGEPGKAEKSLSDLENTENTIMELTQEQLNEMIATASKAAADEAVKSVVASLPPTNGGGHVQVDVITDAGDQPFEHDGEFFKSVKNAALYPREEDARLRGRSLKATGLSEGVPSDGGYLLTPSLSSNFLERMYNTGQILSRITVDPIGPNSNSILINGVDETSRVDGSRQGGVLGYWLAEAQTKTATKPKFRQIELKLKKVAAVCYATDEQLEDTIFLNSWISRIVPDELRFQAEAAIFRGNGVGKPLGIIESPCVVSPLRVDANKIQFADISAMWARRWAGVSDYVWLTNQDVTPQLDQLILSGTANQPTRFLDYGPDGLLRCKGRPVLEVEYASTLGSAGDFVLASLSQYQAISKGGIKSDTSIHVQFLTDETAFRFVYRIDGQALWHSSLTPYQGSNTQSPFVVLSAASA